MHTNAAFMLMSSVDSLQRNTVLDFFVQWSLDATAQMLHLLWCKVWTELAVLIMSSLDVMHTNAAFVLMSSVNILQGNPVLDIFEQWSLMLQSQMQHLLRCQSWIEWAVLIMSSLDIMYTNAAFMLMSSVDILQRNTVLDFLYNDHWMLGTQMLHLLWCNWMGRCYNFITGCYAHKCSIFANVVSSYPAGNTVFWCSLGLCRLHLTVPHSYSHLLISTLCKIIVPVVIMLDVFTFSYFSK